MSLLQDIRLQIEWFGLTNISGTDCRENVKTGLFLNLIMTGFYPIDFSFPCVYKTSHAQNCFFFFLNKDFILDTRYLSGKTVAFIVAGVELILFIIACMSAGLGLSTTQWWQCTDDLAVAEVGYGCARIWDGEHLGKLTPTDQRESVIWAEKGRRGGMYMHWNYDVCPPE